MKGRERKNEKHEEGLCKGNCIAAYGGYGC